MGDVDNHIYERFYYRIAPYAVGMLMGWALQRTDVKKFKMNPVRYLCVLLFM